MIRKHTILCQSLTRLMIGLDRQPCSSPECDGSYGSLYWRHATECLFQDCFEEAQCCHVQGQCEYCATWHPKLARVPGGRGILPVATVSTHICGICSILKSATLSLSEPCCCHSLCYIPKRSAWYRCCALPGGSSAHQVHGPHAAESPCILIASGLIVLVVLRSWAA